jgi:hypothetical protein
MVLAVALNTEGTIALTGGEDKTVAFEVILRPLP